MGLAVPKTGDCRDTANNQFEGRPVHSPFHQAAYLGSRNVVAPWRWCFFVCSVPRDHGFGTCVTKVPARVSRALCVSSCYWILRLTMKKLALLLFVILWSLPLMSQGRSTVHTTRRCTSCLRDKHGHINRSGVAISSFKKQHPCPATGKSAGRCPGYVIDHVKPLECGGTDAPSNMQWQTSAAAKAKDRTEAQCR